MISQYTQTFSGKRVFLTGHTGFKGAWMLVLLNILGAKTKGYSLPAREKSLYNLIEGDKLCESVIDDINDSHKLKEEILEFAPHFIFHFAAQALVRESYENPTETFLTNAIGTMNVLDSLREAHFPCTVVIVTTDKVYENREWWYPYRETDHLGGYDPYSASKACAEIVTASYARSFFNLETSDKRIGIATARAGNVIGGGDWSKDRIIPDVVRALENKTEVIIRNPNSIRPWQHVLEPIRGYIRLASLLNQNPKFFGQSYNFGPYIEDTFSVEELVKQALEVWEGGSYLIQQNDKAHHEAKLLRLDISKSINELDWKPRWNAKKSIQMTMEWYKNYEDNPLMLTEQQIRQYFKL